LFNKNILNHGLSESHLNYISFYFHTARAPEQCDPSMENKAGFFSNSPVGDAAFDMAIVG